MSYRRRSRTVSFGVICVATLLLAGCGERSTEGLAVTVIQQVHPVLIRNDHNAVLQVVVDSKRKSPARLRLLEFALNGADDLNDLESLELYQTGSKQEFAADAAF